MKFSAVAYSAIVFWTSFATTFGVAMKDAPELNEVATIEDESSHRELFDITCYDKCRGIVTGWCRAIYPKCYPLRRDLKVNVDSPYTDLSIPELTDEQFRSAMEEYTRALGGDIAVGLETEEENDTFNNDGRNLFDITCYDKCRGIVTGWCRAIYPKCYPLRRSLRGEDNAVDDAEMKQPSMNEVLKEYTRNLNSEVEIYDGKVDANHDRALFDITCYDKCRGIATGWCRVFYPKCYPL